MTISESRQARASTISTDRKTVSTSSTGMKPMALKAISGRMSELAIRSLVARLRNRISDVVTRMVNSVANMTPATLFRSRRNDWRKIIVLVYPGCPHLPGRRGHTLTACGACADIPASPLPAQPAGTHRRPSGRPSLQGA